MTTKQTLGAIAMASPLLIAGVVFILKTGGAEVCVALIMLCVVMALFFQAVEYVARRFL